MQHHNAENVSGKKTAISCLFSLIGFHNIRQECCSKFLESYRYWYSHWGGCNSILIVALQIHTEPDTGYSCLPPDTSGHRPLTTGESHCGLQSFLVSCEWSVSKFVHIEVLLRTCTLAKLQLYRYLPPSLLIGSDQWVLSNCLTNITGKNAWSFHVQGIATHTKELNYLTRIQVDKTHDQEVKAKILSAIFVRQIGHSEQASEQDWHTASTQKSMLSKMPKARFGWVSNRTGSNNLQEKCRQGRSIAVVGDSKHTLHTWEFASPFAKSLASFSFISCIRAWKHLHMLKKPKTTWSK